MTALLGLIALALVWVGALFGLVWSWNRRIQRFRAAGLEVALEHRNLKADEVLWLNVRSHTAGWSAFYFCFFVLLGLADFPVWQRLGVGFSLALFYGYLSASRETGRYCDRLSLFSPRADPVWLFVIVSAELLGYFGVLICAGQILVEVVK